MKNLFKVLLCGLIAMSLMSGCGSKKDENTDSNNTDQITENTPSDNQNTG